MPSPPEKQADPLRSGHLAPRGDGAARKPVNDIFVLARAVLEAADVLMELLSREPAAMSLPPRTDVVSAGRHVG
jgi:hypothetical protein